MGTHRQKKEKIIHPFNAAVVLPTANTGNASGNLASSLAHIQHASMKSDELLQSILVNNSME